MAKKSKAAWKSNPRRKKNGFTLPMALVLPIAMAGANTFSDIGKFGGGTAGLTQALQMTQKQLTGFDMTTGKWSYDSFKHMGMPILVGFAQHWIASKMGLNRALARARLPILRI